MYTGHVTVTWKDLIPLYTLCQRLKMRGDITKQLLINIRNQYQTNISIIIQCWIPAQSVGKLIIKTRNLYFIIKHVMLKMVQLN